MALQVRGATQRLPEIDEALHGRYAKISKASWADVYFDLYRQTHGEMAEDADIMADAERRLVILERYREAERSGDIAGVPCYLCGKPMVSSGHQCHTAERR
jgi:hypothetical protein